MIILKPCPSFVCGGGRGGVFVREPNSYTMKYLNSNEAAQNLEPLDQRQNIEIGRK